MKYNYFHRHRWSKRICCLHGHSRHINWGWGGQNQPALCRCTTVHHSPPQSTTVHHSPPQSTTVHHSPPQSTTVHHSPPQSTTVHSPPQSTTVHHSPPQSTTVHLLFHISCWQVVQKATPGNIVCLGLLIFYFQATWHALACSELLSKVFAKVGFNGVE